MSPVAPARPGTRARSITVLQIRLFVAVEVQIDWVERDDRGEERWRWGAGLHEVALRDFGSAHAPGDGRTYAGPFQIELRGRYRRLGGVHVGICFRRRARPRVEVLTRDDL